VESGSGIRYCGVIGTSYPVDVSGVPAYISVSGNVRRNRKMFPIWRNQNDMTVGRALKAPMEKPDAK
jgi:hypothetical protein